MPPFAAFPGTSAGSWSEGNQLALQTYCYLKPKTTELQHIELRTLSIKAIINVLPFPSERCKKLSYGGVYLKGL